MISNRYILGIGSVNIDIYCKSKTPIKQHYDHISTINTNVGGVTYNILKNLSALGANIKFIAAVGDDLFRDIILNKCTKDNFDMHIFRSKNCSSGVFMQILDDKNDMYLAMDDMNALSQLTVDFLKEKIDLLKNASAIVCDPAVPIDCLKFITSVGIPVFIDPTSEALAEKIKDIAHNFYMIKPNQKELSVLTNMPANSYQEIVTACKSLCDKGAKCVCVSLGGDGCLYMDNSGKIIQKALSPIENMVNASGRGDAFFSGFITGFLNNESVESSIDYALAAGKIAVSSVSTINENLTIENIKNLLLKENI